MMPGMLAFPSLKPEQSRCTHFFKIARNVFNLPASSPLLAPMADPGSPGVLVLEGSLDVMSDDATDATEGVTVPEALEAASTDAMIRAGKDEAPRAVASRSVRSYAG